MTKEQQSNRLKTSSTGQHFTEGNYLDAHYEAMKHEYESLICSVGIQEGWQVLDAGCGGGSYLPILSELVGRSGTIMALDLASDNVDIVSSRIKNREFACSVDVQLGSVTSLPYDANQFDAVWSANVSQYLGDQAFKSFLGEAYRVLKPGGLLAIKEFDITKSHFYPFGSGYMLELFQRLRPLNIQVHGCFRTPNHANWLKEVGFTNIRSSTLLSELRPPLSDAGWTYISSVLPFWLNHAQDLDLKDPALRQWQHLEDFHDVGSILSHPDFFFKEYHGLAVGQVPL